MVVNYFFNTILLLYLQKMKFYIVGTLDLRLKEDPKKATPQKIFKKIKTHLSVFKYQSCVSSFLYLILSNIEQIFPDPKMITHFLHVA